MPVAEDLTDRTFSRWLVLRRSDRKEVGAVYWWCRCLDCGTEKEVRATLLLRDKSRRCLVCHARGVAAMRVVRACGMCGAEFCGNRRQRYCRPKCRPGYQGART